MINPVDRLFPWLGPSELAAEFDNRGDDDDLKEIDLLPNPTPRRGGARFSARIPGVRSIRLPVRNH